MPVQVTLVPVDRAVLEELVRVATAGASADDVTPPLTTGGTWTADRTEWLRRFHVDRRDGLDGPAREATWAIVTDGSVVGSVRLARTPEEGVLETGVWLTRAARGRGVGRSALAAVVREASAAGARVVRADTTAGNGAAQAVLRRLGFACAVDGNDVRARLVLDLEGSRDRGLRYGSDSQARPSSSLPSSRAKSP